MCGAAKPTEKDETKAPARLYFRARHRLGHAREFQAVYDGRLSRVRGPLIVHALATKRVCPRLGLSVGKRVGNAVMRGKIKRFIREAFRLNQGSLRPGTDYVVGVRAPGGGLTFELLSAAFLGAAAALSEALDKRAPAGPPTP